MLTTSLCSALFVFCSVSAANTLYVGHEEAYTTIQAALDAAQPGQTVVVRDGVYTGTGNRFLQFRGKDVHLKSENGPDYCTIDCEEADLAFYFLGNETNDAVVEGFTIINGKAPYNGGGIYCYYDSSPTIINNVIRNCSASHGGGIGVSGASPRIINNIIADNTADHGGGITCNVGATPLISGNTITGNYSNAGGGGVWSYFANPTVIDNDISANQAMYGIGMWFWGDTEPSIIENRIFGNRSYDRDGGGILCREQVSALIKDNFIYDNLAYHHGGGIFIAFSSPTVIGNTIIENECEYTGGGITVYKGSHPLVKDNYIANNLSPWEGGGISIFQECNPVIEANIVTGNTSLRPGGGINCVFDSAPIIRNNIVTGNHARGTSGKGGGLYVIDSAILAENNTIAHNRADRDGGGISAYGEGTVIDFRNNVLWGNSSPDGNEIKLVTSSTLNVSYSIVSGGEPAAAVDSSSTLTWSEGNFDADPLFASPGTWTADDWTPGDYHLKSEGGRFDPDAGSEGAWVIDDVTSPGVDAGDPSSNYDIEPEPNGGRINIGGYGNTAEASKSDKMMLAVRSHPYDSVPFEGTFTGMTDFSVILDEPLNVELSVPAEITHNTAALRFNVWRVNGQQQTPYETSLSIAVEATVIAIAEYGILGDVVNNCTVDVADLIYVRNHLFEPVNDGNWMADVNRDGMIDLLDLVIVRNNMGTGCE